MHVECYRTLDELTPLAGAWDGLARGVPFRTWTWLSTWWRHYADAAKDLMVLGVFDDRGSLRGIAPWHLDRSRVQGRAVRWLGSGEVCSDHLTILCHPSDEAAVAGALADYLDDATAGCPAWDLLDLADVDVDDRVAGLLIERLAARGHPVHRRPGPNVWRLAVPGDWEQYLAMLSKSHRRHVRGMLRNVLDNGRATLHLVRRVEELDHAIDLLIDLHQRRRRSLSQPGCFSSRRFTAFHRDVMPRLLADDRLRLHWLEIDGKPAAVEYGLAGPQAAYAYQAGIAPEAAAEEPGRLIFAAILRQVVREGCPEFDFLRGDEPYKGHLRAVPHPTVCFRVAARHASARLRHRLWLYARAVRRWVRGNKGDSPIFVETKIGKVPETNSVTVPIPLETNSGSVSVPLETR